MIKLLNVFSLFLLTISFSSCAILGSIFNGGQKPANVKKNNTFEVFCNVEGAKIEVLDKPTKESFEATYTKRGNEYYSTNTYNKLRKGRTKLLISKDGYIPDTIKIKRAPRPGVLIFDICLLTPYSPLLDLLSPDFYKISKKSRIHHVYLSPTQDFMRLKYNEISNKSDVAVFDNFIKEFPNSECVSFATLRRDSIIQLNLELKDNYTKAISTNKIADIREFLKLYQSQYSKHFYLLSKETNMLILEARKLVFRDILTNLSTLREESKQNQYIEKAISDLKEIGIVYSNKKEFLSSLVKSYCGFEGELQLYGQEITEAYTLSWLSKYHPYIDEERSDFEQNKRLFNSVDIETINFVNGEVKSFRGTKNGNILFKIYFSNSLSRKNGPNYIKEVEFYSPDNLSKAKEQGLESEDGYRFDNILLFVFLEQKLNEVELKNIKSVEFYSPDYRNFGEIKQRIKMLYSNGFVQSSVLEWNAKAEMAFTDGRRAQFGYIVSDKNSILHKIIEDIKTLQLADVPQGISESVIHEREAIEMIKEYTEWSEELWNRRGLPWNEDEVQAKEEKTTNFCFEEEYTENRYELKLHNKENGEGKVVYNLYKRGALIKTVTGNWEEKYISLGDATKIVFSMDGGLNMEFYLRKYMTGAWQDLQEMDGMQRTWSSCLE